MNEDVLSKFRQPPRPEFAQALYIKLTQDSKAGSFIRRHPTTKRIVYALAAVCLAFALITVVSPTVRAAALAIMDDIIAKITVKGTTVLVSKDSIPVPTPGLSESYAVIWTPTTPDAIAADFPFFATLPHWIPRGYELQPRAALFFGSMYAKTPSFALYEWKDKRGNSIQLSVMKGSCPNGPGPSQIPGSDCTLSTYIVVGLGSGPQVVAINNQPAVLYKNLSGLADLSDPVRKWNPSRGKAINTGTTVVWENGERTFMLVIESAKITNKDTLRVAESIR